MNTEMYVPQLWFQQSLKVGVCAYISLTIPIRKFKGENIETSFPGMGPFRIRLPCRMIVHQGTPQAPRYPLPFPARLPRAARSAGFSVETPTCWETFSWEMFKNSLKKFPQIAEFVDISKDPSWFQQVNEPYKVGKTRLERKELHQYTHEV